MPKIDKIKVDKELVMSDMKKRTRKNESESIERMASIVGKNTSTVRKWLNEGEIPKKAYEALMAYINSDKCQAPDDIPVREEVEDVSRESMLAIIDQFTEQVKAFDSRTVQSEIVVEYMRCLRELYITMILHGGFAL